MGSRKYKTANLTNELAQWIDVLTGDGPRGLARSQLGIGSRDQYIRIACAFLGSMLVDPVKSQAPIEEFYDLVLLLRDLRNQESR